MKRLISVIIGLLTFTCQLFSQSIPGFYGFQTHFGQFYRADMDSANVEAMLDRVEAAGFKMIRDECYWSEVEKNRGIYHFPGPIDHYIQAAKKRGIDVLLILNYNNPLYAPHAGAAVTTDSNRIAFARYCQEVVKRYTPLGVTHYEIWNEPNIPIFWDPTPNATEYVRLLQTAYPAIKAIDSTVTVIGCATSPAEGNPPPFIDWLTFITAVFRQGGGNYLDAVSFHSYHVDQRPETSFFRDIQKLQAIIGFDLPIWLTEIGYPTHIGWPNLSPEQQANYITRLFLLGKSVPQLRLISYYDLKNDGEEASNAEHNFGVLFFNLQPKPAYHALKTVATRVADKAITQITSIGDIYVYEFSDPYHWITAAWKTSGQATPKIKIPAPFCRLINRDGSVLKDLVTADSTVTLSVDESPRYLHGLAAEPELNAFNLQPDRVILYPQQVFEIRAAGTDTANIPIEFQLAALQWHYSGTGGRIDSLGQFHADQMGSGLLIGSYRAFSDTIFIEIVNPGIHIIDDFDATDRWQLTTLNLDSLHTTFAISDAVFSSGPHSARIDYQFIYRTNISSSQYRIYLDTDLLLPGEPDSLMIDFYGNGQPHKLRFQFKDAFGEQFLRSITSPMSWKDEWRTVRVALKNLPGQVDYPLSLYQITVYLGQDAPQNNTTYQGTIYLDRLRAKSNQTTRAAEPEGQAPGQFQLLQNYPNPFNATTTIRYHLATAQSITLQVFNLVGQEVATLVDRFQLAGEHQAQLNGDGLASGIYFYRLEAGKFRDTKKLLILK